MAIDDTLDTTATFSVMTDDQRRQENNRMEGGIMDRFMNTLDKITSRIFRPFEHDPQGSVFRFWGACLIAMTILFIAACIEGRLDTKQFFRLHFIVLERGRSQRQYS